jgi:hypothetical protein
MRLIKSCFAIGVLIFAINNSNAAPLSAVRIDETGPNLLNQVHWVCGPRRCVWKPDYRGEIAVFARGWPAPKRPNCFWEKRPRGWVHVCP